MNKHRQPPTHYPRENQKARTRKALLEAADELLREGKTPTVAEAAERSKVSRATAYRYFPTQEHLQIELSQLIPAMKPVEGLMTSLPDDVPARLSALHKALNSAVIDHEVAMRTMMRAGLDAWLENHRKGIDVPIREGRRIAWLDQILEPLRMRMPKDKYERLRAALALTLGSDSIFIMKDVCGLDDEEALDVLDWVAQRLLEIGLSQTPKKSGKGKIR